MKNPKVDFYFEKASQWQEEFVQLRRIVMDVRPDQDVQEWKEELKWGHPCYTFKGKNVLLMHGFKEYCALLFHKGVLFKDTENILVQQTDNVQAARQVRFTCLDDIMELEQVLKAYVREALAVEQSGQKVEMKKTEEFNMPDEFRQALDEDAELKQAFGKLTPGRQRGYLLHFSQAKQSKTRISRIEKCVEKIMAGKGWNEQ